MKKRATRGTKKKGGILGKVLLIGGIAGGGYLLYKYVISPMINKEDDQGSTPVLPASSDATALIQGASVQSSSQGTPKFDANKVLRPGMATSPELVYSKKAFNSVIETARRNRNNPGIPKARLDRIAELTLLDTGTKYGDPTKVVANVILGATDFTYARVKQQKSAIYKALGLPDPYGN